MAKVRKRVRRPFLSLGQQYGLGALILLAAIVFSRLAVWEVSAQPFLRAKEQAVQVAKEQADLASVETVAQYNGRATYFSLKGTTHAGESVWVVVPEKAGTIYVYPQEKGLTQDEAAFRAKEYGAATIDRVILGVEEGNPVWEIKSQTAYYLLSFETGQLVKKEGI